MPDYIHPWQVVFLAISLSVAAGSLHLRRPRPSRRGTEAAEVEDCATLSPLSGPLTRLVPALR